MTAVRSGPIARLPPMPPPVTFTLDLEDLRTSPDQPDRVELMTAAVLDAFARHDVSASVYVVGELAERLPHLVREIAEAGHEIGLHAYRHVPLGTYAKAQFRDETSRGRSVLQDLSGQPVDGFRAPMMSLVPECAWVIDELTDLGFTYSSSILPGPSPLYGWDGTPREPFRWWSGLLELPVPLVRVPGFNLPYLGGTYLRLLPGAIRRYGLKRSRPAEVLWAYCHPWEFDPDEDYYEFDHVGTVASRIGWLNRRGMMKRVERILVSPTAPPLGVRAAALMDQDLPVIADRSEVRLAPKTKGGRMMNGLLRNSSA